MESNENFIKIKNISGYEQIINKKYIYQIVQLEGKCRIKVCYPGMSNSEIDVLESLETIYQNL
jgi:hypothetical protein